MKTNPWMKLCKGAALALTLSYGLTFCHTSIGKSESADADKFRPHYHQSFSKDGMEDADGQFMFWYAPEDKWVKIESAGKELRFYQSEDKKEWKEMGSFGDGYGVVPYKFENPVMVELSVDGDLNAADRNSIAPHKVDGYDHRKTASINYLYDFALATWAPIGKEDTYELNVFIDKCSVEIFLNGGKLAMTNLVFPSVPYNRMCFYSKGGTFKVDSFHVYKLSL